MTLRIRERDGRWYVWGWYKGKLVRTSTGLPATKENEELAKSMIEPTAKAIDEGEKKVYLFQDACDRYLKRPGSPGATQRQAVMRLRGYLGLRHVDKIGQADFEEFMADELDGVQSQTARRVAIAYSAVLNYASESLGWRTPIRIKKPKDGPGRDRFLSVGERDLLLSKMTGEVRALTQFLLFTGVRIGEAMKLRWSEVTPDAIVVASRKGKGAILRKRRVPLHPKAKEALEEIVGLYGVRGRCFEAIDLSEYRPAFKRACDAAGIDDFVPHDCRHTFASILVAKGVSLRAVADLLGHTSLAMVMRYAHLSPSVHRASVELL